MTETIKPKREPWTHERFMRLAAEVFDNKYTYELPEKLLNNTKVKAYCPEHGQYFWPNPNDHFKKRTGCLECGAQKSPGNGLKEKGPCASLERLVGLLKEVHGDKYDYGQVELPAGIHGKITVICPKEGHGVFTPSVSNHLYSRTICPKCSREARTIHEKVETPEELRRYKWTPERFYEEAAAIHGDKFEYELPDELKASAKVRARCKTHDVWFTPNIGDHIYKESGCPECRKESISEAIRSKGICADMETFIKAAKEVHGDRYDYSRVVLLGTGDNIEVVCQREGHGSFFPSPTNHVHAGTGCPKCAQEEYESWNKKSQEDFLKDCIAVHGDRYDYSRTKYTYAQDKVEIICMKHGSFLQLACSHVSGRGCPTCAGLVSTPEIQIRDILMEFDVDVIHGYKMKCGLQIDLYCPEHNIGFEYDGLKWHNEDHRDRNYHKEKNEKALEEGIRLIHIYEDDWMWNRDRIVHWILDKVGIHDEKTFARNCNIAEVDWPTAKQFLDVHHIQGASTPGSYNLGLVTKEEGILVSVMCLVYRDQSKEDMVLSRFCTSGSVLGGFSKLLSYFKKTKPDCVKKIYSFSDNGWSNGSIYSSNGFRLDSELPPDYYWVKGQSRYVKERFRRKFLPDILDNFDPARSEAENCRANGYRKLYDSGKKRWVLDLV